MKVYSNEKLPKFQVSGHELRIHWDAKEVPVPSMSGGAGGTQWEQNEALCDAKDGRGAVITAIIRSVYSVNAEFAAINNGGADYEAFQAFRAEAKALADEWMASKA